jgi:hypothetical protein
LEASNTTQMASAYVNGAASEGHGAVVAAAPAGPDGHALLVQEVLQLQGTLAEQTARIRRVQTDSARMEDDNDALARYLETIKRRLAASEAALHAAPAAGSGQRNNR